MDKDFVMVAARPLPVHRFGRLHQRQHQLPARRLRRALRLLLKPLLNPGLRHKRLLRRHKPPLPHLPSPAALSSKFF